VLEIGDDFYSKKFGVAHAETARDRHDGAPAAVTRIDVLHVDASNPTATIVADLTHAPEIADNTFDCIVCVQTLLLIYEVRAAIQTLRRILKPGGVVLVTVPVVSRICRPEADVWGDYWRFTSHSARRLFAEAFGGENVSVEAYGNVLTAAACLYGLAAEELPSSALTLNDPDFEVLVAIRAVKVPSAS
jgi:SAM-dependent methyltransferase